MKCPVCRKIALEHEEIDVGLNADVCTECRGRWISMQNYESWIESRGAGAPEIHGDEEDMNIPEFELARLCPKCSRILVKFKVGRSIAFKIDRCSNCAGVWLDADEWETLRRRNLHDDLTQIFTDHWQEEVSREETRKTLKGIYRSKFGEDDYKKISEFKSWMDNEDKRNEILSYLKDKNPLQF
jgi:Zn-finger nucleic acid-binding protein